MDTLHNTFISTLIEQAKNCPDKIDEIDIEGCFSTATKKAEEEIKKNLMSISNKMLIERRRRTANFEERNIQRWSIAFDLLETHIEICTEIGNDFNNSYRPEAVRNNDLIFDLIVRHHGRACHISGEILCLLKSGYADAAHARWRALHEVTATAIFIAKHGQECAERFYFHDIIDSYDGMKVHKSKEDRLQEKGPSDEEINTCKKQYDLLKEKYGAMYTKPYGWAAHILKSVNFAAIEKDIGLDHMRPYYKWASQNIHASSKGMRNRLGLCEAKYDMILVGQSNSGMTDPAHATAISLCQITSILLSLKPNMDSIVLTKIINQYEKEVGQIFLGIEHKGRELR